jgi:hypothetical protein
MMSISWRRASAVVYIRMLLHTYMCACVYSPFTTTTCDATAAWRAIEREELRAGDYICPLRLLISARKSRRAAHSTYIYSAWPSTAAARRDDITAHTQQGRESSTAAYLVSQNIYLGDSQQGEGWMPACALSMYYVMLFSHIGKWTRKRLGALYRAHSTNRDRHRHKHIIHSAASAAVPFTHIKPTQRKFKGYIIRGDAICAVWGYNNM